MLVVTNTGFVMPFSDRIVQPISIKAVLKSNGIDTALKKLGVKTGGRELLGKLADRYLAFVHARHKNRGNGQWTRTSPRTIAERRNKLRRGNISESTKTLIDTEQLLNVSATRGRGQVRTLDVSVMKAKAGVDGTTVYHDPRFNSNKKRDKPRKSRIRDSKTGRFKTRTKPVEPRRVTLADLIYYHAQTGRVIFVKPDEVTTNEMNKDASDWIQGLLNARR